MFEALHASNICFRVLSKANFIGINGNWVWSYVQDVALNWIGVLLNALHTAINRLWVLSDAQLVALDGVIIFDDTVHTIP